MKHLCTLLCLLGCGSAAPVDPTPEGTLRIAQIALSGPFPGEATLVVGPDGTSVLIDVGNDAHDGAVTEAVNHHLGVAVVDWIVLTHGHADHIGGLDDLLGQLTVTQGVIVGSLDLASDGNAGEQREVIDGCAEAGVPLHVLCPSAACEGLRGQAFGDPDRGVATLDLGGGATLGLGLARGVLATAQGLVPLSVPASAEENAFSLGGFVTFGAFDYVFAGDLTGGGKGTFDVESRVIEAVAAPWPASADLLHLSHHGIDSSNQGPWLAHWLPGGERHALVGANGGYLDAPSDEVLERLADTLDGGTLWAAGTGMLAGSDPNLTALGEEVVVTVTEGGSAYTIGTRSAVAHSATPIADAP